MIINTSIMGKWEVNLKELFYAATIATKWNQKHSFSWVWLIICTVSDSLLHSPAHDVISCELNLPPMSFFADQEIH